MTYLLDTCVISELVKKEPDPHLVKWISDVEEVNLFISVLTIGELHKGIEKLPESRKKERLHQWVRDDLQSRFRNRLVELDLGTVAIWGKIQAESERLGQPLPAIDGLIAATGIAKDLVVVTRNTRDMAVSGVELLNPWQKNRTSSG